MEFALLWLAACGLVAWFANRSVFWWALGGLIFGPLAVLVLTILALANPIKPWELDPFDRRYKPYMGNAGWNLDPSLRYFQRWHDGTRYTNKVSNDWGRTEMYDPYYRD